MIVYRVGRTKYAADITGEGARLNGGRWNHKRIACIYTSENRALAVLEYTVNINIDDIPRALSITSFNITGFNIHKLNEASLPGNWKETPAPASTKDFGSKLLKEGSNPVIQIPSFVVPKEFNYLLNPAYSSNFEITDILDFVYDVRIKIA